MSDILSPQELLNLIKTVFSIQNNDKNLSIIVDVPDKVLPDLDQWKQRREMANEWYQILNENKNSINIQNVSLFYYQNVHNNNADLPKNCFILNKSFDELTFEILEKKGKPYNFIEKLSQQQIILAPTQLSATAPLKVLAKKYNFRAATMPGFSSEMIPALRLDWSEINKRVNHVKELLDRTPSAQIEFLIDNKESCELQLDLRFRQGHASSGLFPKPGVAGNLPSGESYIVPYEGEKSEPSKSQGIMPVQLGNEIVKYRIKNNKAIEVVSQGEKSEEEKEKISLEPAYGNLAELGFGVLEPFGIKPIGSILLDEKLGLHIAFGRSDHFGGAVGVKDFKKPENVVHIDRIYIKETQPRIKIKYVKLIDENSDSTEIIKDNKYTIFK
jgi:hypothetical protein